MPSRYQEHYIKIFMQHSELLLALIATKEYSDLDAALAKANQLLSTVDSLYNNATNVLSFLGLIGVIATVPITLGGSLQLATLASTTAILAKNIYSQMKPRINATLNDSSYCDEIMLLIKTRFREVAETAALIQYQHGINNTIANDLGVAQFARYGASRAIKCIYETIKTTLENEEYNKLNEKLPRKEELLRYLYTHADSASNHVIPNRSSISLFDFSYYAKSAYARPRLMQLTLMPNYSASVDYYATQGFFGEDEVCLFRNRKLKTQYTTLEKYSYIVLDNAEGEKYRNLRSADHMRRGTPSFSSASMHYLIDETIIRKYLDDIKKKPMKISLNKYLSDKFNQIIEQQNPKSLKIDIIAEFHGELRELPLENGNFEGVNFRRAKFFECAQKNTIWTGANLDQTVFDSEHEMLLENTNFTRVTAELSKWRNINFRGATFTEAKMNGAHLISCRLFTNIPRENSEWRLVKYDNMHPSQEVINNISESQFVEIFQELERIKKQVADRVAEIWHELNTINAQIAEIQVGIREMHTRFEEEQRARYDLEVRLFDELSSDRNARNIFPPEEEVYPPFYIDNRLSDLQNILHDSKISAIATATRIKRNENTNETITNIYHAIGFNSGSICIWKNDSEYYHFSQGDSEITCLAWSEHHDYLLFGCKDGSVYLWDHKGFSDMNINQPAILVGRHKGKITCLMWSKLSAFDFASSSIDFRVIIWKFNESLTVKHIQDLNIGLTVRAFAWSCFGNGTLLSIADDKKVRHYNYPTALTKFWKHISTWPGHSYTIQQLAWSSKKILASADEKTVIIRNESGRKLMRFSIIGSKNLFWKTGDNLIFTAIDNDQLPVIRFWDKNKKENDEPYRIICRSKIAICNSNTLFFAHDRKLYKQSFEDFDPNQNPETIF